MVAYLVAAMAAIVIAPLLALSVATWIKLARSQKARAAAECLNALRG